MDLLLQSKHLGKAMPVKLKNLFSGADILHSIRFVQECRFALANGIGKCHDRNEQEVSKRLNFSEIDRIPLVWNSPTAEIQEFHVFQQSKGKSPRGVKHLLKGHRSKVCRFICIREDAWKCLLGFAGNKQW